MKKGTLILIILAMSSSMAYSATVSGVSGVIAEDQSVIISGSDFGSKSTAAPSKWDDFDGGSNGVSISGWSSTFGDPGPVYSNENQRTGSTLNYKAEMNAGDTLAYNSRLYHTPGGNLTTVFVSFWIRWDAVAGVEQQVKTWRLTDTYPTSEDASAAEFTYGQNNGRSYMSGASDCGAVTEPNDGAYTLNQWIFVEVEAQESTAASSDGILRVWKSQTSGAIVQELNTSAFKSRCNSSNHWLSAIFGQYAQLTTGQSVSLYYDDIYIDNTWSRVVIGDNATYSSCTHREIQVPTAWSDLSITITFNQGSFVNSDQVYFFVVDSSGSVSNGYGPLTVGSGTSTPTASGIVSSGVTFGVAP